MNNYNTGSTCVGKPGQYSCSKTNEKVHKPVEIYVFIDPLCPECWGLEPILKKLLLEYQQYFTIRYIMGSKAEPAAIKQRKNQWEKCATLTGMPCDAKALLQSMPSSYKMAVAIKAAELQGKGAGIRYLRKLREMIFLNFNNFDRMEILTECAKDAKLDLEEFERDMISKGPIKSLQCDRRIADEMDIPSMPTVVFFNDDAEKEGIKVAGSYPYGVYVQVLEEMMDEKPIPQAPPDMETFLKTYHFVATKELAVVYDKTEAEILKEMKKLQLKQQVESVPVKTGRFWRYIAD